MINNTVTLTGVIIAVYEEKFDNGLQLFVIEVDKPNYAPIEIPTVYGNFTKGNIKKGDKVVVDGSIDIIDNKVCVVAKTITNLTQWKKNQ